MASSKRSRLKRAPPLSLPSFLFLLQLLMVLACLWLSTTLAKPAAAMSSMDELLTRAEALVTVPGVIKMVEKPSDAEVDDLSSRESNVSVLGGSQKYDQHVASDLSVNDKTLSTNQLIDHSSNHQINLSSNKEEVNSRQISNEEADSWKNNNDEVIINNIDNGVSEDTDLEHLDAEDESVDSYENDRSDRFGNEEDDRFRQRMLLKMLHLDRRPDVRAAGSQGHVDGGLQQVVPEYIQALLHAMEKLERNGGGKRAVMHSVRDKALGDQSIWAIRPTKVMEKTGDVFDALFYVSHDFHHSDISTVQLVLENSLDFPASDNPPNHPEGRIVEYMEYTRRLKALRNDRASVSRSTFSIDVCADFDVGNSNVASRGKGASLGISNSKGNLTENSNRGSLALEVSQHTEDKINHVDQNSTVKNIRVAENFRRHCGKELNIRRRRLVGLDRDHDVFDITRSFLAWHHDCQAQKTHNRNGCLQSSGNSSCNSSSSSLSSCLVARIRVESSINMTELGGSGLLVIYKNVVGDLSSTRRAMRDLASEATKRVRRSPSESNRGLEHSETSPRTAKNNQVPGTSNAVIVQAIGTDDARNQNENNISSNVTLGSLEYVSSRSENSSGVESHIKGRNNIESGRRIVPRSEILAEEERRCAGNCSVNKRSARDKLRDASIYCGLRQWRVNFAELGWDFVIAPSMVQVNYCGGSCLVPPENLDAVNMTNNAFLRLVYRVERERGNRWLGEGTRELPSMPSCVPVATAALNILFMQDDNTIVLRKVNEMTATQCGCL